MKILVADDDPVARTIMKAMLESLGHQVLEAKSGREAFAAVRKESVRVVISDWVMDDLDGLALCKKLREPAGADYVYFILLTGAKTEKEDYLRAMTEGADDFLRKPADLETIWIRLRVAERIVGLDTRIKQLEGFIPICAYCKNIRRSDNVYEKMELYMESHTGARFSHGICPDCAATRLPPEARPH